MHILDSAETAVLDAALEIEPVTTSVSLAPTVEGAEWDAMANFTFGPTTTMDAIELAPTVLADFARTYPRVAGCRYVIHAGRLAHAPANSDPHSTTLELIRVLLELESV